MVNTKKNSVKSLEKLYSETRITRGCENYPNLPWTEWPLIPVRNPCATLGAQALGLLTPRALKGLKRRTFSRGPTEAASISN